ncbi:penicillin-binding protein activator LpoB [Denitrificimonas sp. JX-1]|uniref:Penicillin-binding protein activator LpoB n=1 Tax=Denitrificimonas halotolerans TaxID=3098930 RepID=A0ABU5GT35_9GAMM|nr:penicillin-binding protein activator LpoB [Denitrificimonas sp. JX-1]MDY7220145.1 penicillin-binding protein activator LpoB [Denitrificimonas sp. JX-1]
MRIHLWAAVFFSVLLSACSVTTGNKGAEFNQQARWGLLPVVNFSQAPQAGERTEKILQSVLSQRGIQVYMYPYQQNSSMPLLDDQKRLDTAWEWARQQGFDYVITGSIEEWQYKNGLDGEPAVGISLQVVDPATGQTLWSHSGARSGWSRESLAGSAQKVLNKLINQLRLQ